MTCENCIHKEVCRDNDTNYSEKGGAEHCYFFLEENELYHRFLNKLINVIGKTLLDNRKLD